MDNGNTPEDKARSGPTDGGEPTIGTGVAAEPGLAGVAGAAGAVEPALPATARDSGSRGARHARRRLFGRSARSDNRHKASSVRAGRRPVATTQVVKNLTDLNSRSTGRPTQCPARKPAFTPTFATGHVNGELRRSRLQLPSPRRLPQARQLRSSQVQ